MNDQPHLARVRRADLHAFREEVLADGGRVGRLMFVAGGDAMVEVHDLRTDEVLAAGAIYAHPINRPASEYTGRRLRNLAPARKARARRREQLADLHRELRALDDHAAEVLLYIQTIEAGHDIKWCELPPQVGWWLDGFDGRKPWHDRGGRPSVEGAHDVLQRRRRAPARRGDGKAPDGATGPVLRLV